MNLAIKLFIEEKKLLAEQFNELVKSCITDSITMELSNELFQILDCYRTLFHCSRAEAYRQLKELSNAI